MSPYPTSPVTLQELQEMKASAAFGAEDVRYLKMSAAVLESRVERVLDVWYGFIGSQPQLLVEFTDVKTGAPDGAYLGAVRVRFAQWIRDTARAEYDQKWLDYQLEIGRRHHRIGKNKTDGANASPLVRFRHLFPLVAPVISTLTPFLAEEGHGAADVAGMQAAWLKSVLIQLSLWSHPYIIAGDF